MQDTEKRTFRLPLQISREFEALHHGLRMSGDKVSKDELAAMLLSGAIRQRMRRLEKREERLR